MKKNTFLLFFGFMLFNTAIAQSDKLNKFEGTWQWKSNDSTFTVALKQVKFEGKKFDVNMPDSTVYIIIGWHELKVKGAIVKSSMENKSNTFNYAKKNHSFIAYGGNEDDNNDILLTYYTSNFPSVLVRFTILEGDKAKWDLKKIPGVSPGKVTLTKIK